MNELKIEIYFQCQGAKRETRVYDDTLFVQSDSCDVPVSSRFSLKNENFLNFELERIVLKQSSTRRVINEYFYNGREDYPTEDNEQEQFDKKNENNLKRFNSLDEFKLYMSTADMCFKIYKWNAVNKNGEIKIDFKVLSWYNTVNGQYQKKIQI